MVHTKMSAPEVQESNFNVIVRVRPLLAHSTTVESSKEKAKSSAFEREQVNKGAFAADANRTISVLDESIILFGNLSHSFIHYT